jgi:hypothetical protein
MLFTNHESRQAEFYQDSSGNDNGISSCAVRFFATQTKKEFFQNEIILGSL